MPSQHEHISQLFQLYIADQASKEQVKELLDHLKDPANDSENDQIFRQTLAEKISSGRLPFFGEMEDAWQSILESRPSLKEAWEFSASRRRVHFLRTSWFRYAAAIILMLGVGSYLWFNHTISIPANPINSGSDIVAGSNKAILTLANGQQIILDSAQGNIIKQGDLTVFNEHGKLDYKGVGANVEFHTLSTPKGGQYKVVLPDGTNVWLNAASSITYPTAFTGKDRAVAITGEAYFEVMKNVKAPFKVTVNNQQTIEVLGTSFNVNAYKDENIIKTTLISGSIKVVSNTTNGVVLKPGEQAIINHFENAEIQKILIQTADIEQALAWKNGVFLLSHTNLAETMQQLARWYDIEVVYEKGIPDIKLDGDIKRNLTFSQMLDVLNGLGVKFRIEGRKLIIVQ